ncbi:TetR/AcrR family transcriptional regulator [Bradyrhizobium lablabi]|uniref:TetR/AcrR family transcriptional regulator n=1 Tax=Bradyrhizobium lablabi TaxID=722472 RepID=UPI001BA5AA7C|nr:TetR/AcrR family transcriptional regulator [Bradyrhizobium lablabi]MBR1126461.1 TetR/AcrR family transcriptional regulator [Bradyrhizobium lablabi]
MEAAFSAFTERGFAETSTLEIATRARASKRELYAEFGSKQDMLVACIRERADRLKLPVDLPEITDRATLERTLVAFGTQLLREVSDPAVVAVFRLAISEAVRAPEVAQTLNDVAIATSRAALREIMRRAVGACLLDGEPVEIAEHFFGLLWGSKMLGLLLNTAKRPGAGQIALQAERVASIFLLAYPAPALVKR